MICISLTLNEASFSRTSLICSHSTLTSISCCRFSVQSCVLPSPSDSFVVELLKDIQVPKLLEDIAGSQVSLTPTASNSLASSDESYDAFLRVDRELSHKEVFLGSANFTSGRL